MIVSFSKYEEKRIEEVAEHYNLSAKRVKAYLIGQLDANFEQDLADVVNEYEDDIRNDYEQERGARALPSPSPLLFLRIKAHGAGRPQTIGKISLDFFEESSYN